MRLAGRLDSGRPLELLAADLPAAHAANEDEAGVFVDYGDKLAVALRAAADQLGYCRAPGEFEHLYGRIVEVDDLLAIAAELDGATTTSENDYDR
jgi:hypothetical protein